MSLTTCGSRSGGAGSPPTELVELQARLQAQSPAVRAALEPLVEEAMESARFRHQVLNVARDALERFKLDLEVAKFDLDVTRRERENLRRILAERLSESEN